jgi:hypothetical protein
MVKLSADQIANTVIAVIIGMAVDYVVRNLLREWKRQLQGARHHQRRSLCFPGSQCTSRSGY